MTEEEDKRNECVVGPTDAEGNPNLCCCYAIDDTGEYVDPCYQPVEDCCCG